MGNERVAEELLRLAKEIGASKESPVLFDLGRNLVKWFKSRGAKNIDVDFGSSDWGVYYNIDFGEGWNMREAGIQMDFDEDDNEYQIVLQVDDWDRILKSNKVPTVRDVQKMIDNAAKDEIRHEILLSVGVI